MIIIEKQHTGHAIRQHSITILLLLTSSLSRGFHMPGTSTSARRSMGTITEMKMGNSDEKQWTADSVEDSKLAKDQLSIWPLDEFNAKLLNEVHPKIWETKSAATATLGSTADDVDDDGDNDGESVFYDFIAIGAGAAGLVSSRQARRRGAKSAMISSNLAGGDCLNVGCVPSKALIRCGRMIREVKKAKQDDEFGINISGEVEVDFGRIMKRMRKLRSEIAPIDGHDRGKEIGVDVYQGKGRFIGTNTLEVTPVDPNAVDRKTRLRFKKAAICTGGRAFIPDIPGLKSSQYTTNENLFNLSKLPPRMVVLGSGVVALEMAQTFASFGSKVTVLARSDRLFPSSDPDAGPLLRKALERDGVTFLMKAEVNHVTTLEKADHAEDLPLLGLDIIVDGNNASLECECLLVAAGRIPNIEELNLEAADIEFDKNGIIVDDSATSTNPLVFAAGDCCSAVPRLTHMSGEMAKVVVQNSLFDGNWKISSLVVPSCMYTEPEYASVGILNPSNDEADTYYTSLEHNDRSILDSDREGYVKIITEKGSGTIIGCSIVASRAGELINEVTLAMKNGLTLEDIGRNIHCYPTTGESIMGCGLQLINSNWKVLE